MANQPNPPRTTGVPSEQFEALAGELVDFIQGEPKRYESASGSSRVAATEAERRASLVAEVAKKVAAMVATVPAARTPPTA